MSHGETWLAPLISALGGMAGGGGIVSWMQRGKTAADAELSMADADKKHAEAESLTVQTIQNALVTVERLSAAKDEQLAQVRSEMQQQNLTHTEQMLAQANKHGEEMRGLRLQIQTLVEQQGLIAQALSAHGQWDLYVLAHVRQTMPEFPDPPPLGFILDEGMITRPSGGQAT